MTHVNLTVQHLEKWLFKSYEPNKFVEGEFWNRCEQWLRNIDDTDARKTLYRLLTQIFYIGPAEFEELYRCAYDGPIAKWLIDKESVDVFSDNAQQQLVAAVEETWICPVTDSLRINSFFHINNLPAGANLRPDWCSLLELGDEGKIRDYCNKRGISRLVLLEDFVGGGSQSIQAVEFAAKNCGSLEVLFVPLIICPDGADAFRILENRMNSDRAGSLRVDPVLELTADAFFTEHDSSLTASETDSLRAVIDTTYQAVSSGAIGNAKPYHRYGYPQHCPTGGLVVMFTNTPDNTLPLIHWRPKSGSWNPVFPRHSRV